MQEKLESIPTISEKPLFMVNATFLWALCKYFLRAGFIYGCAGGRKRRDLTKTPKQIATFNIKEGS
jgi:hypothetical protein